MGEKPVNLSEEQWEGTWLVDEGAVYLEVTDAENGKLMLTAIEGAEPEVFELQIRTAGDWMFGSVLDEEDADDPQSLDKNIDGQPRYTWGRIKNDGDQITFWVPDVSKFRALVKSESLPGVVKDEKESTDTNVYLGELKAEHYELITSGTEGVLMQWEDPIVLIRFKH
jgi:hypothetical protein